MNIPRFKFSNLVIGDTLIFNVEVQRDGDPYDLTGCTLFFTVKDSVDQADADARLALETGSGITQSGSDAEITVTAGETDDWPTDVELVADLQVKTVAGEIFTAAIGTLRFRPHVTRRIV